MVTLDITDLDLKAYVQQITDLNIFKTASNKLSSPLRITDSCDKNSDGERTISIFLTATETSKDVQARNCIVRPFRAGVLLDRIQMLTGAAYTEYPDSVHIGDYVFYIMAMRLEGVGNKDIKLTEKERDLLYYLYQNQNQIVSRDEILSKLWGYAEGIETHTLETHFYRLRQKIETDPAHPALLVTEGGGYCLKI